MHAKLGQAIVRRHFSKLALDIFDPVDATTESMMRETLKNPTEENIARTQYFINKMHEGQFKAVKLFDDATGHKIPGLSGVVSLMENLEDSLGHFKPKLPVSPTVLINNSPDQLSGLKQSITSTIKHAPEDLDHLVNMLAAKGLLTTGLMGLTGAAGYKKLRSGRVF